MPPFHRTDFRTAIICALQLEADAVETQITHFYRSQDFGVADGDTNTYTLGQLGGHDVVVVWMPSEGNSLSSGATASLLSSFPRIDLALLVGICAGVPCYSKDDQEVEIILGDVVISTAVIEYDHGRQYPDTFQKKETLSQAPIAVKSQISKISARRLTKVITNNISTYLTDLIKKEPDYAHPGTSLDRLFDSGYIHKHHDVTAQNCTLCSEHQHKTDPVCEQARKATCQELQCDDRHLLNRHRLMPDMAPPIPAIHFGRIASGNVVMKSGEYRDRHSREEGVIAFEMEAAGIWSRMACIVMKGVCDYADSHKNKRFQKYAAATAAACARAVLEELPAVSSGQQSSSGLKEECDSNQSNSKTLLPKLYVTEAHLDIKILRQSKGDILPEAFSWILSDRRFVDWRNHPLPQLLCIKGGPGKGKTMISLGIIDHLSGYPQERTRFRTDLAYFFCQNTDDRRRTSNSVVRGLLWLLIDQNRSLERHLRKAFNAKGETMFEGPETFRELWEVFIQILQDEDCATTVIVIDAIDECDQPGRDQLLQCIQSALLVLTRTVKWILTSRDSIEIERYLLQLEVLQHKTSTAISLEDEQDKVSEAVNTFIESRVNKLAILVPYSPVLKQFVATTLKDKAEGTFLWVSLVCERLQQVSTWQTEATLRAFPPRLTPLYDNMLGLIQHSEDSDVALFCKKVLRSALIACRPLHLIELGRLAGLPKALWQNVHDMRDLIARCGFFLNVKDRDTVHFVHQSAKDYLGRVCRSKLDSLDLHDEHLLTAKACVGIMVQTLRRNMGGYNSLSHTLLEAQTTVHLAPNERCDYSVQFWSEHIAQAILHNLATAASSALTVEYFIRQSLLCWLEYLALTNKLSIISTTINSLLALPVVGQFSKIERYRLTDNKQTQELRNLISETARLCISVSSVIEIWPLQIYSSALLFSPQIETLRQNYKSKFLKWVNSVQTATGNQHAQHTVVEGLSTKPNIMALSPDSRFIVLDAAKSELRICHADTGAIYAVIQHASRITSVVFSRDSRLIATGSEDAKVTVFKMAKEQSSRIFTGHRLRVNAVASSPCEDLLASASDDRTIILWDLVDGCPRSILEGHRDLVQSIAFHQKGKVLASGSTDMTVVIWNVEAARRLASIRLKSVVTSVNFSKNGKFLVCGLGDGTIVVIVMQGSTLNVLRTIEPFKSTTTFKSAIDISPDSKLVLSTCPDRTIKLWDIETGNLRSSFSGHQNKITAASFFPHGRSIASACWDKTVRIWDAEQIVFGVGTEHSSLGVASIAFSPNGKLIATAHGTPEVTLWDVKTAAQLHNLTSDTHEAIWKVTFSDDGTFLYTNGGGSMSLNHLCDHVSPAEVNVSALADVRDTWILWKEHRLIWLPSDYRPLTFAIQGDKVALLCRSSRMVIVSFDPHETEVMLKRLHG